MLKREELDVTRPLNLEGTLGISDDVGMFIGVLIRVLTRNIRQLQEIQPYRVHRVGHLGLSCIITSILLRIEKSRA